MKRYLWNSSISENSCPPWECSACSNGTLRLKKESLQYEETRESKRSRSDEEFDANWIEYSFTAWANCNNQNCMQSYAISGLGGVEPRYTGEDEWDYFDAFYPKSIHPTLNIITIPSKCPREVKEELKKAFSLYWANNEACTSRIRVALEHLLSHIGIPKQKTDENGKSTNINLHTRIETYAKDEPQLGQHLMALKWIGNTSSHDGAISHGELIDAFEILEYVLSEIIQGNSKRIASLARKLAEKHGKTNASN
jgi:uncharacterized protein DUF4145